MTPSVPAIPTNTYTGWVGTRKFNTQSEFQDWLVKHPFNFGTLVALNPDEVTRPQQVHMVVGINADYHMLDWDRGTKMPKCYEYIQLKSHDNVTQWRRWDSVSGYRLLTEKEIKFFEENHNDSIQNCFKLFQGPVIPPK